MNDQAAVVSPFAGHMVKSAAGAVSEAVVQREVAEVQAGALMAKRFPRDPIAAMDRILTACSRPTLAEVAFYQYARGGTDIDGPSIRLAEELARGWGNINTGITILSTERDKSECVAYAWDLETLYRQERRFTVKHWRDTKGGGYALKDERDIYELCANMGARRQRACILAVIPGDVVEAAAKQCQATLQSKLEITPEYIEKLIAAFAKYGVTQKHLETFIQRRIDTLTPQLAVRLKKIGMSLQDGVAKPEDFFDMTGDGAASAQPVTRTQEVKEAVRKKREKSQPPAEQQNAAPPPFAGAPVLDEAQILLKIDGAANAEDAATILDTCRDCSWYPRAVEAYNNRWRVTL